MNKYDVRRQTDSRVEKVRLSYSLRGMPFPEQHIDWLRTHVNSYAYGKFITNIAVQSLNNYTKEHNMTPLQTATNKRAALIAQRTENCTNIAEFDKATVTLAERNAVLTTEILALSATIGAEERKEREAKHKAMADELRAAGYKVEAVTGSMKYPQFQQIPKGLAPGDLIFCGIPISRGKTRFFDDILAMYGDLTVYDSTTDKVVGTLSTTLAGGGKAPGMNTPGTGAGSAQPAVALPPKLGGVHGVGEEWYRPIVYVDQVKLEHDFAINTRDHHEARNGWWLKHVPSGHITKGFPSEEEACRWIKARTKYKSNPNGWINTWQAGHYREVK